MKVLTILGTRPEIIRLSRVIARLDAFGEQVVVHTGQNFDRNLNDVFFEELGVRAPDIFLEARGSFGQQIARILSAMEEVLLRERPDRFLVLGDTNSSLAAVVAKRLAIPVYHMEAGNRCYDDRVPEEVNRRIIDHSSDVLLPYTERSRMNLLREGIPGERIYVTGNPIKEVLDHYAPRIAESRAMETLGVEPGRFFLVTLHRAENVDIPDRLASFVEAFRRLHAEHGVPVIVSLHPRTALRLREGGAVPEGGGVRFVAPLGLFDFVRLEQTARCVLSDSGTVQEECSIFRVPNVTLRDVTERPETIERGSNVLSGADPGTIAACVRLALALPRDWDPPPEYLVRDVSGTVAKIVLGFKWR